MKPKSNQVSQLPPCIYGQPLIDYFGRKDVRTALHIPDSVPEWDFCSATI